MPRSSAEMLSETIFIVASQSSGGSSPNRGMVGCINSSLCGRCICWCDHRTAPGTCPRVRGTLCGAGRCGSAKPWCFISNIAFNSFLCAYIDSRNNAVDISRGSMRRLHQCFTDVRTYPQQLDARDCSRQHRRFVDLSEIHTCILWCTIHNGQAADLQRGRDSTPGLGFSAPPSGSLFCVYAYAQRGGVEFSALPLWGPLSWLPFCNST